MGERLPFHDDGETRTFTSDVDSHELKWHRDEEDRIVTPIGDNDWLFQRDNCLPHPIDREITIPKGEWHRVIKGTTNLKIRVQKGLNGQG